jgi:hypothetical protein
MTPLKAGHGTVGRLLSAVLSYSVNCFTLAWYRPQVPHASIQALLNTRWRTTSRQRSC